MSNAEINTDIEISPSVPVSIILGIYLGVELQDHMLIACLTFQRTTKLFHSDCTVLLSTSNVGGF